MRKKMSLLLALTMIMSLLPMQLPVKAEATPSINLESTSQITTGATIYFGQYTKKDNSKAPILWHVMGVEEGKATLLSDEILEYRQYDSSAHDKWSGSDICNYLNSTTDTYAITGFLTTAFTTAEQGYITTYSTVEEQGYKSSDTFKADQKIVLPSVNEVNDNGAFGFKNYGSRKANNAEGYKGTAPNGWNGNWWLRSPGYLASDEAYVRWDGYVRDDGSNVDRSLGVRPALKLNLSSVLFTSVTDIEVPEKIEGITHAISSDALKAKLKEKVKAKINNEEIYYTVEWDVKNSRYNATDNKTQTFEVTGKILPEGVVKLASGMSLDTSVLVAVDAAKYDITYNLNEGIQGKNPPSGYTYGVETTLPTPTRGGYNFEGWYTDIGCTKGPVTTIIATDTGDKTYWAKWTANSYKITYNPGVGKLEADAPSGYTYGVGTTLPILTKEGYSFGGWYTNEDYTGNRVSEIIATDTGDKTYWAKWTVNSYNITYNLGGGTLETNAPSGYTYGLGTALLAPTKEGYSFEGWYTDESYTKGPVSKITATDTGDKEYWAKWTVNSYNITYNLGGGTLEANAPSGYTYGLEIVLPTPTREGHSFVGWYTDEGYTQDPVSKIIVTDTGDKTYWAKWTVTPIAPIYTVSFDSNGGNTISTITDIPLNTTITLPTPIRANYRFEGWYEGNVQYTNSTLITKSVTLVAKWSDIGTSSGGNTGGSTTSTTQKTTKERIVSLSSSQKQAVANYFKEELPYTTMNPSFVEEALKRLTDKQFTEAQVKEILGDKALLKQLDIENNIAISLINLKPMAHATFTDVATNHWANEAIKEAAALGLVTGMPDGSFAPSSPLQVADTFTFLDRVLLLNDINDMKLPRITVEKYMTNKEHWAFATMASIASKLSESTLKTISELGDKPLSRELLAQVLYEVTDGKLELIKESIVFEDTENSPYKEDIDYCVRAGLLSGVNRTHMAPTKSVTRAELMTVLIRLNNALK